MNSIIKKIYDAREGIVCLAIIIIALVGIITAIHISINAQSCVETQETQETSGNCEKLAETEETSETAEYNSEETTVSEALLLSSTLAPTEPIEEPVTETVVQVDEWVPSERDVELIAKTLYGECRGIESTAEKAAVVWCILNRLDRTGYACGKSIEYVITFPNQFQGYNENYPVTDELKAIAEDVLIRHHREQNGEADVGRVLPVEYIYFIGDGEHNYFTQEFLGKNYYDWSLANPYED